MSSKNDKPVPVGIGAIGLVGGWILGPRMFEVILNGVG